MTRARRAAGALLLAALALAASGCGVEAVPDPAPSSAGTVGSTAPTGGAATGSTGNPGSTGSATPSDPADLDTAHGTYTGWTSEIRGARQREIRCDGGPVTIDTPSLTVELTGRCGAVTVSAVGVTALAEDIGTLTVTGKQAYVVTRTLGSVSVSGKGVDVHWVEGDPTVVSAAADTSATRIPAQ